MSPHDVEMSDVALATEVVHGDDSDGERTKQQRDGRRNATTLVIIFHPLPLFPHTPYTTTHRVTTTTTAAAMTTTKTT